MRKHALRRLRPQPGLAGGLAARPGAAALERAALPGRASSPSPSPSGCASACCTSPGGSCARAGAWRCGCRAPGPGPRRWRRPSRGCGRCRSPRAHSRSARSPSLNPSSPHLPISACPRTGADAPIRRRLGLERSAKAVPRNRPGAVTYLKSADHTLRGENGGSRARSTLRRATRNRLARCSWSTSASSSRISPSSTPSTSPIRCPDPATAAASSRSISSTRAPTLVNLCGPPPQPPSTTASGQRRGSAASQRARPRHQERTASHCLPPGSLRGGLLSGRRSLAHRRQTPPELTIE